MKNEKRVKMSKIWREYFDAIEPFWIDYIKVNYENPPNGEKIKEKYKAYIEAERKTRKILKDELSKTR